MKNQQIKSIGLVFAFTLLFGGVMFFGLPQTAQVLTAKAATQTENQTVTPTDSAQISPSEATPSEPVKEDTGVIGLFGLNWKLFLAQLVNFGIVLFVLWRWVFKPVVAGMEARTKKIEDSLNTADKINLEKQEFEQWKTNEMMTARQEASTIISEAKQTATQTKDQILEQAKAEQQQILEHSKRELEQQKIKTLEEAQASIADLVVQSTEKLLRAKLDGKTDAKLIQTVLTQTDKELS